jgi:D-alanyl-D-alanine dipeptidase
MTVLLTPRVNSSTSGSPFSIASNGACYFAATNISREARTNRALLAEVLTAAGLVNYPTEWWHWSYGDRYWAYAEDHPAALYGPAYCLT